MSLRVALLTTALAVTAFGATIALAPTASGQCPRICQTICAELHITCRDLGNSNGLDFTAGVEQNETAVDSQVGPSTPSPVADDPIEDAGTLRILSTWHFNATQEATVVQIQLGTPTGVTYTSSASASYNQTAAEDMHEEAFDFVVNGGFSGTASIPYVITTNAGTASEDVLNGTLTFEVESSGGVGSSSPSSSTPPPGLAVILVAIIAALALLRDRLTRAGKAMVVRLTAAVRVASGQARASRRSLPLPSWT